MILRRPVRRRAATLVVAVLALTAAGVCAPTSRTAHVEAATVAWAPSGQLGGLGGGRIWSLAFDPADPHVALAGTDAGVYRSADGAQTWSLVLGGVRAWSVGFDLRKPNPALAALDGGGVRRSDDGGSTWTQASSGLPSTTVRVLAFALSGVVAGTSDGVAVSADGSTWHAIGLHGYDVSALCVAANAPAISLIAGVDNAPSGSTGYLFRDVGLNGRWTALNVGPKQAVVSSATAGPLPQDTQLRPLLVTTNVGVYHSGDGGTNWTKVYPPQSAEVSSGTLTTTQYSPLDPKLVYAGNDAGGSGGGALLRSTDGGLTFNPADQGLPNDHNVAALAVAPVSPPLVIAAIDPPKSGALIYAETDSSAPAPAPTAPPEVGAPLPQPTSLPTFKPEPTPAPAAAPPATSSGFGRRLLGWPLPLAAEILVVLLVAYLLVRWRQRRLDVEGPP